MRNLFCVAFVALAAGCASTDTAGAGHFASKFRATDGRVIEIGKRSPAEGGWSFQDPHLDKCWISSNFDFAGYDTLYIAPTLSTAKLHGPDEVDPHELAKKNLVEELKRSIDSTHLFPNVVTAESDIKPGARVLKLENTIVNYAKGGGAARYFAGLYGAGQPVLVVRGQATEADKTIFTFQATRSGVSGSARMFGGFRSDVDIQREDIQSMTLDLSDFVAAIGAKYQAMN
jgi:hypothetical protein